MIELSRVVVVSCLLLAGCDDIFDLEHVAAPDASTLPSGLVAHWPMDSLTSGSSPEVVAGRDALCTACPTVVPGKVGNALQFVSAQSQVMSLQSVQALETSAGYAVSAWLREDLEPAYYGCAVSKLLGSVTENSWQFCFHNSVIEFFATPDLIETTAPLGMWLHVVGQWDGAHKQLWINGILVRSLDSTMNMFDGSQVLFGADIDYGAVSQFLDGTIDDVRVYNRALTPEEITSLANGV